MLKITVLQTPGIELDGVQVALPFKRADALLYYMMIRKSATRQELISLLWESDDEAKGLKNLRNALYTLKKALGGEILISPQKSIIAVNPEWEIECDYDRFIHDGDFSAYQGIFLNGFAVKNAFALDEWIHRTREKLHAQYLRGIETQAKQAYETGDIDEAIRRAQNYLVEDPYDETMVVFLMERLKETRKYAQAAKVYQNLKENLSREMGVDPMESTTLLHYEILNQWNDTAGKPETEPETMVPPGRQGVYDLLRAATDSFSGSSAWKCSQLLVGEAGSGKSVLINHLLRSRNVEPLFSVRCECLQSEVDKVLAPWQRILLSMMEFCRMENIVLPEIVRERLGKVFSFIAPSDQAGSMEYDRSLEDSMLLLFSIVGRKKKTLLVLEEAQWADYASLMLLNALVRRLEGGVLMVILTTRYINEDAAGKLITSLESDGVLHRQKLRSLSWENTAELLRRELGDREAELLTGDFYHETSGNMNLLYTLIQAYRQNSDIKTTLDTIGEILMNRLNGLSAEALDAARWISLGEKGLSSGLLPGTMEWDVHRLVLALEELRSREIIEEYRLDSGSHYRFVHKKIRSLVYDHLSAYERSRMHARIAKMLIDGAAPNGEAGYREIAEHYHKAGDKWSALEYTLRALDCETACRCEPFSGRTIQAGAARPIEKIEEEAHLCHGKLSDLEKREGNSERSRMLETMLAVVRGRIALFDGDSEKGSELLGMLSGFSGQHNPLRTAEICELLAGAALYQQASERAERYVSTGMRLMERDIDSVQMARLHRLRGCCFCLKGDYDKAGYYLQEATDTLEKQPRTPEIKRILGAVYGDCGRVARCRNDFAKASRYFKKALDLLKNDDCAGRVWVYVHYGRTVFALEDHFRAKELFFEAYRIADETGELWGKTAAAAYCAYFMAEDGEYERAAGMLMDAAACAEKANSPLEASILCFVSMHIRRRMDMEGWTEERLEKILPDSVDDYARRGIRLCSGIPDVYEAQMLSKDLRDGITSQLRYRSSQLYSKKRNFMSE